MNSVIKGASYVLAHTPDMVLYNGTTQTTERIKSRFRVLKRGTRASSFI